MHMRPVAKESVNRLLNFECLRQSWDFLLVSWDLFRGWKVGKLEVGKESWKVGTFHFREIFNGTEDGKKHKDRQTQLCVISQANLQTIN